MPSRHGLRLDKKRGDRRKEGGEGKGKRKRKAKGVGHSDGRLV